MGNALAEAAREEFEACSVDRSSDQDVVPMSMAMWSAADRYQSSPSLHSHLYNRFRFLAEEPSLRLSGTPTLLSVIHGVHRR